MNVQPGTIARTICLCLALANQLLVALGYKTIDISNDNINTLISTAFTIAAATAAWWKNNSFTEAALKADETLKNEKLKQKSDWR